MSFTNRFTSGAPTSLAVDRSEGEGMRHSRGGEKQTTTISAR